MPLKIKKYFSSTSTERKGMFVLVFLLMLTVSFYWVDDYFYDSMPLQVEIEEIEQSNYLKKKSRSYHDDLRKVNQVLFQFNPNTINKEKWIKLGFSNNQAQSIVNFRKSGFTFKSKEDLKKLFVVDEKKYKQLEPYVIIPKENLKKEKQCYRILYISSSKPIYEGLENLGQVFYRKDKDAYKYYSMSFNSWEEANVKLLTIENNGYGGAFIDKMSCEFNCYPIKFREKNKVKENTFKKKRIIVWLNKADTTELKTLKGVGGYYAKKIVSYRKKLGGFYRINQILEVYGVKPEILENNKEYIQLDTNLISKMNINTISKEELKQHPYIKWSVANSIVLYRINHGEYKSVQNIQNSDLVNDELYRKIVRYLTVK